MKPSLVLLLGALGTALASPVRAQTTAERPDAAGVTSLKGRFGLDALRRLLRAESSTLRQRALERLGRTGTNAALELLAGALAPGGEARDARERLLAVRALAGHVDREMAVDALVRALAGGQAKDDPREGLVQETAALALARSHRPRAQKALAQALRQPGRVSETARAGLTAHRPASVVPLLEAAGPPTVALVQLLGELADPKAAPWLASLAETGSDELRAASLLALRGLDRPRALGLARSTLKAAPGAAARAAAVRVLLESGASEAPGAFAALLLEPAGQNAALALAVSVARAELGPVLARLTPEPSAPEPWLAALGRSGGTAALSRLEQVLPDPERGWAAAYALARAGDSDAEDVLERALEVPETRREAARAAALRSALLARDTDGLGHALEALERSALAADRASSAFARALLNPERGAASISAREAAVVCAAARAASRGPLALAAAERLARERDPLLRACLASSLLDPRAADRVPDRVLIELLESRGAAAHLGAYALAARDGAALRPRLRELLASNDPLLRAHVALGLARSRDASAVGMLAEAYRFEAEPRVRRALIAALAARSERGRRPTLRLAADLDPDRTARERARHALAGAPPAEAAGLSAAWLRLDARGAGEPVLFAVIETPGGLALPAASDPDGAVTFFPLPPGAVHVTLAQAEPG